MQLTVFLKLTSGTSSVRSESDGFPVFVIHVIFEDLAQFRSCKKTETLRRYIFERGKKLHAARTDSLIAAGTTIRLSAICPQY